MQCPYCKEQGQDKVIDSRATEGGRVIRRRRQCLACNRRYTTYERIEETGKLAVIKRDGNRVPYDRAKVFGGLQRACWKRPISADQMTALVNEVEEEIFRRFDREVPSVFIGNAVAERLQKLDKAAYLRFASVHREFTVVGDFIEEARNILEREEKTHLANRIYSRMNDRTKEASTLNVKKRDGSIEAFTPAKVLACLHAGMHAAGEFDPPAARALSEAVRDYVADAGDAAPLPAQRIADMIELVLTETGHPCAAEAIRRYADLRARHRRRLLVAGIRGQDTRMRHRRWRKEHLVQHLRRKQLLDAPVSRMIAGRVEQLLFNCGLRVVTAGLVREMTRSELMAWGLAPGALAVSTKRRTAAPRTPQDQPEPS